MEPMLSLPVQGDTQRDLDREVARIVTGDLWWLSQKVDGDRRAVTITDTKITGWTRDGGIGALPRGIADELARIRSPHAALDGELLDGVLYLFDMPYFTAAGDIRITDTCTPLERRLEVLDDLCQTWQPGPSVQLMPVACTTDAKVAMIEHLWDTNGEGVIAKRRDSVYVYGKKSPLWRKIKFTHDVDCVVNGLRIDGKQNMAIAMYQDGKLVNVGEVSALTGDGPQIVAAYEAGETVVVKVKILYSTEANRLYQPTLPRIRYDKPAAECGIDQLDSCRANRQVLVKEASWLCGV